MNQIIGTEIVKRIEELKGCLETLLEQGFLEFIEPLSFEEKEILDLFFQLGLVNKPKTMSGSTGATLKDIWKANALLRLLNLLFK